MECYIAVSRRFVSPALIVTHLFVRHGCGLAASQRAQTPCRPKRKKPWGPFGWKKWSRFRACTIESRSEGLEMLSTKLRRTLSFGHLDFSSGALHHHRKADCLLHSCYFHVRVTIVYRLPTNLILTTE